MMTCSKRKSAHSATPPRPEPLTRAAGSIRASDEGTSRFEMLMLADLLDVEARRRSYAGPSGDPAFTAAALERAHGFGDVWHELALLRSSGGSTASRIKRTLAKLAPHLPDGTTVADLGAHWLKG